MSRDLPADQQDLFSVRREMPYNESERLYSEHVQEGLEQLLAGTRSELILMRQYHDDPDRIAVLKSPPTADSEELRRPVIEQILTSTIVFVRDTSPGGPVFQRAADEGVIETQYFGTRYPHIIVERRDRFDGSSDVPIYTEWRLRRMQNQRKETQINRVLDVATLGFTVLKSFRKP